MTLEPSIVVTGPTVDGKYKVALYTHINGRHVCCKAIVSAGNYACYGVYRALRDVHRKALETEPRRPTP